MSSGFPCQCPTPDKTLWRVIDRNCNHSAFNGYQETPSRYSSVICLRCQRTWRTKAAYVDRLMGMSLPEREARLRGEL